MADHSNKQITTTDTFQSWKDKYNQIPDYMETNDTNITNLSNQITATATQAEQDALVFAIALG